MEIRQSHFYTEINELLRQRLPIILNLINGTLSKQNDPNKSQLEIYCSLETHPWQQVTQWRIETNFEDYENGYNEATFKPYCIGGYVSLEEVNRKQMLYCNYGKIYNTFKIHPTEIDIATFEEQIVYTELENKSLTAERLRRINLFLDSFHDRYINEIDSIDFKQLGNTSTG